MNWTQVKIETSIGGLDLLIDFLTAGGVESFEVEDPRDFEDFLSGTVSNWDYVDEDLMQKRAAAPAVKIYLPQNSQGSDTLAFLFETVNRLKALSDELSLSTHITTQTMREEDWANNWKAYYKPVTIANRLIICPAWESLPKLGPGMAVVWMDPGMAFGTGAHETTRLCLKNICDTVSSGDEVLDLGCGSGILSISAIKLGAKRAFGVDIDQNAVDISQKNAALNHISPPQYQAMKADLLNDPNAFETIAQNKYDLVFANIVADIILPLFPLIPALLKENGCYIVSGIIAPRKDEIIKAAQANGFSLSACAQENDWNAFVFRLA